MICAIHGDKGLVLSLTAEPRCGDFCDTCGDCLHCFGEDKCGGVYDAHSWIVYANQTKCRFGFTVEEGAK